MVVVVVIYLKSQNHMPRKPNSSDYKKATSVLANVKATTLKAKTKATIPKAKATIPSLRPQKLVAWLSGRTSVSGRRTFPVLRLTCS